MLSSRNAPTCTHHAPAAPPFGALAVLALLVAARFVAVADFGSAPGFASELAAATRASFFSAGFSTALSLAVGGAPVIFSLVAGFSAVGGLSAANGFRRAPGLALARRAARPPARCPRGARRPA